MLAMKHFCIFVMKTQIKQESYKLIAVLRVYSVKPVKNKLWNSLVALPKTLTINCSSVNINMLGWKKCETLIDRDGLEIVTLLGCVATANPPFSM